MPASLNSNSCCSCIDKRTRCLIIGYIELVFEVIAASCLVYLLAGGYWYGSDLAVEIVLLVYVTSLVSFTISLLFGVYKNKRKLLKAYLVFSCANLVIQSVLGIYFIVLKMSNFVGVVSAIFLRIYIIIVVHDQYEAMAVGGIPGIPAPTSRTPLLAEI